MEKNRFMLVHNNEFVYRFESLIAARSFAEINCRRNYNYYIIVDTVEDKVVASWSY